MEKSISIEKKNKARLSFSIKKFFILFKMLLQDKTKISFKANKKQSLIKLLSLAILFVLLCAISFMFYQVSMLLNIFAATRYVPQSVPTFFMAFLMIFGFISLVSGLNKTLYYSKDNQIMITYPCSGSTIFFARLAAYGVNQYLKNVTIQIPLLIGYMLSMNASIIMYFWLFVAFFIITIFEVLLASIVSISVYYVSRFLKYHPTLKTIIFLTFYLFVIALVTYLVLLIPDNIDIFTNVGTYYGYIRNFLNSFIVYASPFYYLNIFSCGQLFMYSFQAFSLPGLYSGLTIIGLIGILFVSTLFLVNPLYFKLASSSFEFEARAKNKEEKNKKRSYYLSQIKKELLLIENDNSVIIQSLGAFIFLPLLVLLLNKIFGGMNVNGFGNTLVMMSNLAIILLIALNANSIISTAYSSEGTAFYLNRSYPKKPSYLLFSKLITPMIIGELSLFISCIIIYSLYGASANYPISLLNIFVLFFALSFIYVGHMLYSAGLDFTNIKSNFLNDGTTPKQFKTSTILAFIIPFAIMGLFYLYIGDGSTAYLKIMIIGIIYLIINIVLFIFKAKLLFKEGD